MIEEDYVSFETAKLLKEKGFNERCSHIYRNDGMHLYCGDAKLTTLTNTEIDEPQDWVSETFACACPTFQMAMKWLREVHKLEIYLFHDAIQECTTWWYRIEHYKKGYVSFKGESDSIYVTYEEACEAAIKYCLENLI